MAVLPGPWQLALDLGTTTTRFAVVGRPGIQEIPTSYTPAAGGREVRPIVEGAVQDFDALEHLLGGLLQRHTPGPLRGRQALVSAPSDWSELERRALTGSLHEIGIRSVTLVPTILAAGIGCGLPVERPRASMVVHVGASRSEVGVLCFGQVVARRALRRGGHEVDQRILAWIRGTYDLLIPAAHAEALKRAAATGTPPRVEGRVLGSGEPRVVSVDPDGLRHAVSDVTVRLRDAALDLLRELPAELCSDLLDGGVFLTGGGALAPGLADQLRDATGLPVLLADAPATRVIDGLVTAWSAPVWRGLLDLPI